MSTTLAESFLWEVREIYGEVLLREVLWVISSRLMPRALQLQTMSCKTHDTRYRAGNSPAALWLCFM